MENKQSLTTPATLSASTILCAQPSSGPKAWAFPPCQGESSSPSLDPTTLSCLPFLGSDPRNHILCPNESPQGPQSSPAFQFRHLHPGMCCLYVTPSFSIATFLLHLPFPSPPSSSVKPYPAPFQALFSTQPTCPVSVLMTGVLRDQLWLWGKPG